jgi:hypothetical protein
MSEQKVRLLLRISASLKKKLTEMAEREHRSVNGQIEFLLDKLTREGGRSEGEEPSHQVTRGSKLR